MSTTATKVVPISRILKDLESKVQEILNETAMEAAEELRRGIDTGEIRISTDTGMARESIYTIEKNKGTEISGYASAVSAMKNAGSNKYSNEHIEQRTLEEYKLTTSDNPKSAVSSASLVLGYWEDGHDNKITKQYERAPRFRVLAASKRNDGTLANKLRDIIK